MDLKQYMDLTWQQFGASIKALRKAIEICPDDLWGDIEKNIDFWYNAYHTLFWLDLYLEPSFNNDFIPPEPFGLEELDPAGLLPPRVYTKAELLEYTDHNFIKCKKVIYGFNDESANIHFKIGRVNLPRAELMLYSMRHVQHHAAQLNYMLRKHGIKPPGWMFGAE